MKVGCEVRFRHVQEITLVGNHALFVARQLLRIYVIPSFKAWNDPALDRPVAVNAYPEEHPEERLEIVHKGVLFAKKRPDGHESPRASLSLRPGSEFALFFDGKIKVNQERRPRGVIGVLVDHEIAD